MIGLLPIFEIKNRAKIPYLREQWEEGAISQGKWTGVPLKDILEKAGLSQKCTRNRF